MNQIIDNQPALNPGYNCRQLVHYDCTLYNLELPTFEIERCRGYIRIDLDPASHSAISTVGSTLQKSMTIQDVKLSNLVHDVTVGHLTPTTDKQFCSVFPIKGDGFDGHSPDLIVDIGGSTYYVVEFTTNRAGEAASRNAALSKIAKYEIPCQNRSVMNSLCLGVISVHRDGVWSNLTLTEEDVNELAYRYRLALDLFSEVLKKCPEISSEDSEMSKQYKEINGILSLIDMDWEKTESSFPMFKKKMFEDFQSKPLDSEYISRIISKSLSKCHEDLLESSFLNDNLSSEARLSKNSDQCESKIVEFVEEYNKSDFLRDTTDHKSTAQIPPWVSYPGDKGKGLSSLQKLSVSGNHPMSKVWEKVVRSAIMEEIERMHDDPEAELEFAMSDQMSRPDERNKYHRVRINLSNEEELYLSCFGVGGKSHRNDVMVEENRARSKKAFSIDHDTTSLESFLTSTDKSIYNQNDELYCPLISDLELRKEAISIHQPRLMSEAGENEFLRNHINYMQSALGSWTQMVSLIGAELSASVKQHVKPRHFIVKRLLDSGIYLLIKPTSSKGHIFVSFALDKSLWHSDLDYGTVFKSYIDSGDLLVTDFVSYKLSKLTNLCKTNSLVYTALCFWAEVYSFTPWTSCAVLSNDRSCSAKEVSYMTKLSMMTLLEDKTATEELQTFTRYIIMEGFVSQPEIPKPHKMISKLPYVLRSELQVMLINKIFMSMRRIAAQPFTLSKKGGQITWNHLFNPFTQSSIRDIQPMINCCYNGYFKNKEEETEPSVLSKMYKKIIELEHLCPEDDRFLGSDDPEEPKMHEFSRSYLLQCVQHGKQLLSRMHGQNFMDLIDEQITREVSQVTIERLATLKATSNFNENWYVYKDVKDKNYTRDKLLVKMSHFASEGNSLAIQKFEECMNIIERRGSMHICLFKKQQHGGLREIYVMGAEERIVQSLVETIARSIGKFFPSDTLCNPANKTKIPESHGVRARKHCEGSVWTCSTSDDARKWNQGHFVSKFALMLREFTHPKWWPIITRGCSMFTSKKMMMNLNFIKILDGHKELKTSDEFATTLFRAYHGEIKVPWLDSGRTYLKTKTGMMQGILHFTSSLLHTIHQEFIRSLTFKIFNSKVHPEMSYKMVCDMMQGSDDSSMMISFPAQDEKLIARCKVAAALSFRIKKMLGVYIGIYPSEKSTSNTDFVMEYNSEFYFHSQHVRPTIRWISASCSLPEVETLVARQEEAANLLTAVTEGGGSFSLASCVQHAQCTIHYMLMGMGVSELFYEYREAVKRWKDPGIGFFLFDNPYATGLGGFRYNLYKAITKTNLQKIYAYFLKRVKGSESDSEIIGVEPETCSVSPGGAIILSSSLKWGSRQKFYKLRDRLNIPYDWVDKINSNPSVLYRAPQTGDEILLRIAEKVHSPGVVSSLSSGNAVAKVMASAVYFLSAAIFEDAGRPEYRFFDTSKYSLLHKLALYKNFSGYGDISDEDLIFLFPNIEELQQLDLIVFNKGKIDFVPRTSQKEATQTRVIIFDQHNTLKVEAEKLVSDKWFGTQKCRIGSTTFNLEWDKLKTIVTWLRDTPDQTLDLSPFSNHVQIRNFFARMESRPRAVKITGAPVKKRSGISKISIVIRDNFARCGYLKGIEDSEGTDRSNVSGVMKHFMYAILQGPYTDDTKRDYIEKVMRDLPDVGIRESDRKTKSNLLGIIQHWVNNPDGTADLIENVGAGIIGGFILPQKSEVTNGRVSYYGTGSWRGFMDGHQVQIDIYNEKGLPPHITSVTITEKTSIWDICGAIRLWSDDVGVVNNVDVSKKSSRTRLRFWLFEYRPAGVDKPFGAPVYVIRSNMSQIDQIKESDIRLKVRRNVVNLYIRQGGRDMHILSYSAGDNDLNPVAVTRSTDPGVIQASELFCREPSSSWLKCESLPVTYLGMILDLAEGTRSRPHIDSPRLKQIIRTCTESSLRSKVGSIFQLIPGSVDAPQVFDINSVIDIMIDDMTKQSFEEVAKDIAVDIEQAYTTETFDFTDIDLFGPAHHKEVSDLAMVSHPLMDEFIECLISRATRKEIRKALEEGVCSRKNENYFRQLFRCICRDPESLRIEVNALDLEESSDFDNIG
ncbi:RNA-dependent RNA polymerase [Uriurana virus]|uniref:RNA-directed RNA polymerase L n=1 Tax=Uriurana virus TaxID=1055750 RepID=I1T373_9VIRU|nr:RNA-dependent RNA polymerase [Uriurana virus]YP_010839706.1 polymerase [Uriurana virus]AEL29690.1 polymerase [Uriurana virus]API68896.1 RNA-dependent RNA polymerase [Uriurana virus]